MTGTFSVSLLNFAGISSVPTVASLLKGLGGGGSPRPIAVVNFSGTVPTVASSDPGLIILGEGSFAAVTVFSSCPAELASIVILCQRGLIMALWQLLPS